MQYVRSNGKRLTVHKAINKKMTLNCCLLTALRPDQKCRTTKSECNVCEMCGNAGMAVHKIIKINRVVLPNSCFANGTSARARMRHI